MGRTCDNCRYTKDAEVSCPWAGDGGEGVCGNWDTVEEEDKDPMKLLGEWVPKADFDALKAELAEIREQTERAMQGECGHPDEVHCSCRPILLRAIKTLKGRITELESEANDA